jgi:serine protease Do
MVRTNLRNGDRLPNGMTQRHQIITGVGSGFFISPDGYAVTNKDMQPVVVDAVLSVEDRRFYQKRRKISTLN